MTSFFQPEATAVRMFPYFTTSEVEQFIVFLTLDAQMDMTTGHLIQENNGTVDHLIFNLDEALQDGVLRKKSQDLLQTTSC